MNRIEARRQLMKLTPVALLCATFLSASSLSAQPAENAAEAALQRWKELKARQERPDQDPFLRWMDRIAQQQLQRRESAIAEIRTVADAERRKEAVRKKILAMMGGLPDYKGPLNPRVTGRIQNESFTIAKV